jgi:hypothetical protein
MNSATASGSPAKYVVAHQEGRVAVRRHDLVAAHHRRETDLPQPGLVPEPLERGAQQRAVHVDRHAHDHDALVEQVRHLDRARQPQHVVEVPGVFVVLVDQQIHAQLLEIDVPTRQISRRRHPRHRPRHPPGPGENAGQDVRVVAVRHRHNHIRPFEIRLFQRRRIRPVAVDRHQVQMGVHVRQGVRRGIDHGHVVFVLAELFRQMGARLAAADDYNAHGCTRF